MLTGMQMLMGMQGMKIQMLMEMQRMEIQMLMGMQMLMGDAGN